MSEDDLVSMPMSWPWCAPEHTHHQFQPAQARKMDIFSFGMLCVWVLFEKYLSRITSLPQEARWAKQYFDDKEERNPSLRVLDDLKQADELAMIAKQLVLAEGDIGNDERQALEQFFGTSLVCNSNKRVANLRVLCSRLRPEW